MNSDSGAGYVLAFFLIIALIYVAVIAVGFWAGWRIVAQAGYPGWYVFGYLIPIFGIVLFFMFAFKQWPVRRELEWLRAQVYGPGGQPGAYPPLPPAGYAGPVPGHPSPGYPAAGYPPSSGPEYRPQ